MNSLLDTLDTLIALLFVLLMFSLIVGAAREVLAAMWNSRGKVLREGMDKILTDIGGSKLVSDFWSHVFVQTAQPESKNLCYLPPGNAAAALLHLAAGNKPGQAVTLKSVTDNLANLGSEYDKLKTLVATVAEQCGASASYDQLQTAMEKWVDQSMHQISAWYHARTRWVLFILGLVIAGVLNVDALNIWQRVSTDKNLRTELVKQAEKAQSPATETDLREDEEVKKAAGAVQKAEAEVTRLASVTPAATKEQTDAAQNAFKSAQATQKETEQRRRLNLSLKRQHEKLDAFGALSLPIGWEQGRGWPKDGWSRGSLLIGWLFSALAATLGATFWFDLLQRFMNIRAALKPLVPNSDGKKP